MARSAVLELGRGLRDPSVKSVRPPKTLQGPRLPFLASPGRVPRAQPPTHAQAGLVFHHAAAQTLRQAPGCVNAKFQTQGFQSLFEKAPEVFALNSDEAQHARCFGRNSIILINNKHFATPSPATPQIFHTKVCKSFPGYKIPDWGKLS